MKSLSTLATALFWSAIQAQNHDGALAGGMSGFENPSFDPNSFDPGMNEPPLMGPPQQDPRMMGPPPQHDPNANSWGPPIGPPPGPDPNGPPIGPDPNAHSWGPPPGPDPNAHSWGPPPGPDPNGPTAFGPPIGMPPVQRPVDYSRYFGSGSTFSNGLLGTPPMFPQRPPNGFASLMGPVHYPNYHVYYHGQYYQNY